MVESKSLTGLSTIVRQIMQTPRWGKNMCSDIALECEHLGDHADKVSPTGSTSWAGPVRLAEAPQKCTFTHR